MKWTKSILVYTAALFLFVGTIGVNIFSHVCEKDGLNVSYFVPVEDVCNDHDHGSHHAEKVEDHHDSPCCEESNEEDGCCSTSSELVKVNLDFLNKVQVTAILIDRAEVQPVWIVEVPVVSEDLAITSGSDPPPKLRQEILVDHQQWLI